MHSGSILNQKSAKKIPGSEKRKKMSQKIYKIQFFGIQREGETVYFAHFWFKVVYCTVEWPEVLDGIDF